MESKNKKRSGLGINSYRNKIVLSYVVAGAFTLALSLSVYFYVEHINKQTQEDLKTIQSAQNQLIQLQQQQTLAVNQLAAYLNTGDESTRISVEELQQQIRQTTNAVNNNKYIKELDNKDKRLIRENEQKQQLILSLQSRSLEQIQDLLVNKNYYKSRNDTQLQTVYNSIQGRISNEMMPLLAGFNDNLDLVDLTLSQLKASEEASLQSLYSQIKWIAAAAFLMVMFASIFYGFRIVPSLLSDILHIKNTSKTMRAGNIPEKLKENNNETNLIIREINELISNLMNIRILADKVGNGEFDTEIVVFNNEGELGNALANMRKSLAKVSLEDKHRNWVNHGVAQMGDVLRINSENVKKLSEEVIIKLVKQTNANQGAIYLLEETKSGESQMRMMACYAYERKKKINKTVALGEGMVGQAWREKDNILITDIPQDFIKIRSGLGGQNPKSLLVMPLIHNEEVIGVVELAAFHIFEDHEIAYLNRACENIGASVATTRNNEKTKALFRESQQMTEEMKAQEEEMRQNMEEMAATQEEMIRTQEEIKRKEFNLNGLINNTSDTIFAINTNYEITVINKVLHDKYKGFGLDLKEGTNILELLKGEAKEKWKMRYDRALAGERFTITEESSGSNGERFSETYHNPIRDENGHVIGVSVISRDVTEQVKSQTETNKKQSILNALINNTDDTYFALDTDYKILIVNNTLKDRFAQSGITIEEGKSIFDVLPQADWDMWKERYDRALSGESFIIMQERKVAEKTLYLEGHYNPIKNEKGDVIGASVMSRDITRYQDALKLKETNQEEINKLRKALGIDKNYKIDVN